MTLQLRYCVASGLNLYRLSPKNVNYFQDISNINFLKESGVNW